MDYFGAIFIGIFMILAFIIAGMLFTEQDNMSNGAGAVLLLFVGIGLFVGAIATVNIDNKNRYIELIPNFEQIVIEAEYNMKQAKLLELKPQ